MAPNIRPYENVTFALSEAVKRGERTAVIQIRMMGHGAVEVFPVGHRKRLQSQQAVVFYNHDSRAHTPHGFPDPVIVPIHVDRKQSDILPKPGLRQQRVDVLPRDPRVLDLKIVLPVDSVGTDVFEVRRAGVENQALPVVVEHQEPGIALFIVLHSEFDKCLVLDADLVDQVLNDAVLIPLRKDLESDSAEIGIGGQTGHLPGQLLAQEQQSSFAFVVGSSEQLQICGFYSFLDQRSSRRNRVL